MLTEMTCGLNMKQINNLEFYFSNTTMNYSPLKEKENSHGRSLEEKKEKTMDGP